MNWKTCVSIAVSLWLCNSALAAKQGASDALVDQVIKKMESSGALDRAIERYVERQKELQQKAAQAEQNQRGAMVSLARKVEAGRDHIWGSEKARISIIVYSDLECPFCKRFGGIPESVAGKFGDRVNVVWRHFPLEMHGVNARKEAIASECVAKQAGAKGFFGFVNQTLQESRGNGQGLDQGDMGILALASRFGANDVEAMKTCLTNGEANAVVDADLKDGISAGINGTPGVLLRDNLSGKTLLVGGAIPESTLEEQVRSLLAETQGTK